MRQPLADLGIGGVIAAQQLDLYARRQILSVLFNVEIEPLLALVGGLRDKARVAVDQPDFDGLRRER